MQPFVDAHRALILRHARSYVKALGEKIAAEDVAREIELELTQLGATSGLTPSAIEAPDAYVRSLVKHASGRARRRRTLIEQLAAGDDLDALSRDLAALDADLPPPPPTAPSPEATAARAAIDAVKDALSPADALVFALLIEDDGTIEDAAAALGMTIEDVAVARERALAAAAARGIEGAPRADRRGERA